MIEVGTSGFSFPDWVGNIYPANIKKGEMLPYGSGSRSFLLPPLHSEKTCVVSPPTTVNIFVF